MITFYGYKRCGTARKGEKYLGEKGVAYTFVDITEEPPSREQLAIYIAQSGKPVKAFFNTSGVAYKEGKMKARLLGMRDDEKIDLLAQNGRLIKRPIVTDGKTTTVGFKLDEFENAWG